MLPGGLPLVHEDELYVAGHLQAAAGHGAQRLRKPPLSPASRRHNHAVRFR
jgi:hypothetical protein